MQLRSILSFAALVALTRATTILLPLYVYPTDTDWAPVYQALQSHPDVEIDIVVNPDNGPTPQPDGSYLAGIRKLRTYPNAIILAYVPTGYGRTSAATIKADIDQWNSWPADVRPEGVFFDEAERGEVAGSWRVLRQVANYAHDVGMDYLLVNNVGTRPVNNTIYGFADQTIIYESSQANYAASSAEIDAISVPGDQLSIIIYSLPASQLRSTVRKFVARDYGSVYFTSGPGYTSIYPDWQQFVTEVDNAQ